MDSILVAIIGGLFSLAGIWLKHHLDTKGNQELSTIPSSKRKEESQPVQERSTAHPAPRSFSSSRVLGGVVLLTFVGLILAVLTSESIPVSDSFGWFLFFLGGAFLVYGLYLLASGLIAKAKG